MDSYRMQEFVPCPSSTEVRNEQEEDAFPALYRGHPSLVSFAPGTMPASDILPKTSLEFEVEEAQSKPVVRVTASVPGRSPGSSSLSGLHGNAMLDTDYLVAVVDRVHKKMRLVEPAGEVHLSRLQLPAVGSNANSARDADDERTYAERRVDLLNHFGSKKAKSMQEKRARARITDAKISSAAATKLESALEVHQDKFDDLKSTAGTTAPLVPPHNSNATTVEDAYPVIGLMPPLEYTFFRQEASAFLRQDLNKEANPGWHEEVWDILLDISHEAEAAAADAESMAGLDTKEQELFVHRLMSAMLLHGLIVLTQEGAYVADSSYARLAQDMAVTLDVLESIFSRFTEPRQGSRNARNRFRSEHSQSQSLYYAVILWLTAKGFTSSGTLDKIASALQISPAKFMIHVAHIGGKVKRLKSDYSGKGSARGAATPQDYRVSLSVPLVFPALGRSSGGPRSRRYG